MNTHKISVCAPNQTVNHIIPIISWTINWQPNFIIVTGLKIQFECFFTHGCERGLFNILAMR